MIFVVTFSKVILQCTISILISLLFSLYNYFTRLFILIIYNVCHGSEVQPKLALK